MLNKYLQPLPTFEFQTGEDFEDLPSGYFLQSVDLHITGTLTVAGGTTNGTLMTERVPRLIRSLRVVWDGMHIVGPISGRLMHAVSRRLVSQVPSGADIANAGVQTDTPFEATIRVPFSRPYLANPFDTVLPPLTVKNSFRLYVQWETERTAAGSDQGSGAFITGGDRTVTLSDVQCVAVPKFAQNGVSPWYIPVIEVHETTQFAAANQRLEFRWPNSRKFDSVLLACQDTGANDDHVDLINSVTMIAGGQRPIDNVDFDILHEMEQYEYPGVNDANEAGILFLPFADGGKLVNAVDPAAMSNLRFEFDVDAPASGPGVVRAVSMQLHSVEGVTQR